LEREHHPGEERHRHRERQRAHAVLQDLVAELAEAHLARAEERATDGESEFAQARDASERRAAEEAERAPNHGWPPCAGRAASVPSEAALSTTRSKAASPASRMGGGAT
jgi:hypothetical protein